MTGSVIALSRRSVINTLRQPQMWFPSIMFPLILTALNTSALGRAEDMPGFPGNSFLDFAVATAVIQGVLFGSSAGGSDMALDIQGGFFDRLVASPAPRWGIVAGRLAGAAVLGAMQALIFMATLTLFGANIRGGPAAVGTIVLVAMLLAMAIGGLSVAIALRTGSAEVVQAFFPVFFISLFASSAFFPTALMSGWFKIVAEANPLTFMINAVRHLVIEGFDVTQAVRAVGVVGGLALFSMVLSLAALRARLASAAA